MNTMLAGIFGGWEIVLILAMALLLFGSKKLPELAKGLGQGIKEFKKATREVTDEMENAMHDNHTPPPPQKTLPPSTIATSEPVSTIQQTPPAQKV
jgi:sec-independent protein translocase protein TatA